MKELYLEVFSNVSENGICLVPLETIIVLFFYGYCDDPPLLITLVQFADVASRPHFRIELPKVLFEVLSEESIEGPANLCKLPLMVMGDGVTCVAGLCSVLRQLARIVDEKHPVLGFKQNCLYACAETSMWTRFCEVDIISTVNDIFRSDCRDSDEFRVPLDVARFEVHLEQPVRAHNIQKQRQDAARKKGIPSGERIHLEHAYSEGHRLSLADLILLPCYHLVLPLFDRVRLRQLIPLTYKWYDNLMSDKRMAESLSFILDARESFKSEAIAKYSLASAPKGSLNKSSSGRGCRAKRKSFTKQEAVEKCLDAAKDLANDLVWGETAFGREVDLNLSTALLDAILEGSEFPEKRLKRKSQQLENMAKAVLKIARPGQHIVDFCSGSGYLGLVLAHFLPLCAIVLLENKEESLRRAQQQARKLKLGNVTFCRSNIDYFRGNFDIGVSLHSCGVATDLVMEKCLERKASFVCCPCCYGAIQANHSIEYPRSEKFRKSALTVHDYLTLAHSSDQTHEGSLKTSQGRKCMAIIDVDRCLRAQECGYSVSISTLEPMSCTPKNTLLVGIPPPPRVE